MIDMFEKFSNDFPEYASLFKNKIAQYVNVSAPRAFQLPEENKAYFEHFKEITERYTVFWKLDCFFRTRTDILSYIYVMYLAPRLLRRYRTKNRFY